MKYMKYVSLKYKSKIEFCRSNQVPALQKICRYRCMSLFRRQSSQRNPSQCCGGSLPAPLTPQGQISNSAAHSGNLQTLSESERSNQLWIFRSKQSHTFISHIDRGRENQFETFHGPSPHHACPERLHQRGLALLPIHVCCEDGHHQLDSPED